MLGQTKENVLNILTKLQAYESGIASLTTVHKDFTTESDNLLKEISKRKITLVDELHRLLS